MTGVQTCALPICFPVTIRKVRREEFADGGERVMEPAGLGGEFLGPGVRRGEEEKAAREDQ